MPRQYCEFGAGQDCQKQGAFFRTPGNTVRAGIVDFFHNFQAKRLKGFEAKFFASINLVEYRKQKNLFYD